MHINSLLNQRWCFRHVSVVKTLTAKYHSTVAGAKCDFASKSNKHIFFANPLGCDKFLRAFQRLPHRDRPPTHLGHTSAQRGEAIIKNKVHYAIKSEDMQTRLSRVGLQSRFNIHGACQQTVAGLARFLVAQSRVKRLSPKALVAQYQLLTLLQRRARDPGYR